MAKRSIASFAPILFFGILGSQYGAAAQDSPELRARLTKVLTAYRCSVTADLVEIQSRPHPEREDNRYLILESRQHPEFYAQCAFFDKDRQIHCEAASGFYSKPTARFITGDKRAVLAQLGFSTDDSKGNFVVERTLEDKSSLASIAELLLVTLVRVFDFEATDTLMFNAPLLGIAPGDLAPVVRPPSCINVSELRPDFAKTVLL